jgi:hypothetical protein
MFYVFLSFIFLLLLGFFLSPYKKLIGITSFFMVSMLVIIDLFVKERIFRSLYDALMVFYKSHRISIFHIALTVLLIISMMIFYMELKKKRKLIVFAFTYVLITLVVLPISTHAYKSDFKDVHTKEELIKLVRYNVFPYQHMVGHEIEVNDLGTRIPSNGSLDHYYLEIDGTIFDRTMDIDHTNRLLTTDNYIISQGIGNVFGGTHLFIYDQESKARVKTISFDCQEYETKIIDNKLIIAFYQNLGFSKVNVPTYSIDGKAYEINLDDVYYNGINDPGFYLNFLVFDLENNLDLLSSQSIITMSKWNTGTELARILALTDSGIYYAENTVRTKIDYHLMDGHLISSGKQQSILYHIPFKEDLKLDFSKMDYRIQPYTSHELHAYEDYLIQISDSHINAFDYDLEKISAIKHDSIDRRVYSSSNALFEGGYVMIHQDLYDVHDPEDMKKISKWERVRDLYQVSEDDYLVFDESYNSMQQWYLVNRKDPNLDVPLNIGYVSPSFTVDREHQLFGINHQNKYEIYDFSDGLQFVKVKEIAIEDGKHVYYAKMKDGKIVLYLGTYYHVYDIETLELLDVVNQFSSIRKH